MEKSIEKDIFGAIIKKTVYLPLLICKFKTALFNARMVELVYTYVSEAYASQLASSSLASGTLLNSRPHGSGSFLFKPYLW